jgi:hypothetical protein
LVRAPIMPGLSFWSFEVDPGFGTGGLIGGWSAPS